MHNIIIRILWIVYDPVHADCFVPEVPFRVKGPDIGRGLPVWIPASGPGREEKVPYADAQ